MYNINKTMWFHKFYSREAFILYSYLRCNINDYYWILLKEYVDTLVRDEVPCRVCFACPMLHVGGIADARAFWNVSETNLSRVEYK